MLDRIAINASGLGDIEGSTGAHRVELHCGPDNRQLQGGTRISVSSNTIS
ncbi:hypothetical protein [Xanthomonas phaseoli]|uniref:Uncharacterized protein n=1 Tax=Xanthomonas manihotis TaxID=43353 RepID=A0A8I2BNI6_XANMN|nr:hypothetical protein [Xanthomonas phaseoli]MBO9758486.1 hypothetical protein [Xanthomonas phaseoli pv. manihotis]UEQ17449.1 hypothetical protein K9838_04955 [Xanthomonas phaseoli pv. manihotis]